MHFCLKIHGKDNLYSRAVQLMSFAIKAALFFGFTGLFASVVAFAQEAEPNYLHTEGNKIVDANGNRVILTGINWFGLETESFAPHGLWARNWESILDQVQELGFNTIRIPYSNELFDEASFPNSVNYEINPDLVGLNGLEIMDKVIEGAGERGIKVILDRHRPDSRAQSELWYTARYNEERWISDWVMLAERYKVNDTVIGMDLHNEPHGQATWGTEDADSDWRLAAERAGNAILAVNPELLIIVQGVDQYQGDWYWWGGNLIGAREFPVRLDQEDQLVYSTHVYGPGVYPQPWFSESDFPDNLPGIWAKYWGYLSSEDIAPIIVGEFGGRSVGEDAEGIWQRTLVSYLRENNLSYFYWTLNPNSGDTGGLLLDDWQSVDPDKQALLSDYQFPSIGAEIPDPEPIEPPATPLAVGDHSLIVTYRTANAVAQSQDAKPEFVIANKGTTPLALSNVELLYWLADDSDQQLAFHCDWAAVGCSNVMGNFGTNEDGERYLRLYFTAGAGILPEGQDSGEIKVRFNRTDWSPFDQGDDYSFAPLADYQEWERVTLYVDGQPVWGSEPGSTPAAAPTVTAPTITVATALPPTSEPTETPIQASSLGPNATGEVGPTAIAAGNLPEQPGITPASAESATVQPAPKGLPAAWIVITAGAVALFVGLGMTIGLLLSRRKG